MKLQLIFAWYDLWVGFFWDSKKHWLYFFPIPMCGIIFKFKNKWKPFECEHEWEYVVDNNRGVRLTNPSIMRCNKCKMYMGGIDSYQDVERGHFEWKDDKKDEVIWQKDKNGNEILVRCKDGSLQKVPIGIKVKNFRGICYPTKTD